MNTNLKKLAKKGNKKQLLVNVLMIIVLVIGVFGLIGSLGGDGEALPYTAERAEGERTYVDAQYASDYFAYFETNEADKLYFVMDKDMGAYIVCVSDKEIDSYAELQAFTYGETTKEPAMVRLRLCLTVFLCHEYHHTDCHTDQRRKHQIITGHIGNCCINIILTKERLTIHIVNHFLSPKVIEFTNCQLHQFIID